MILHDSQWFLVKEYQYTSFQLILLISKFMECMSHLTLIFRDTSLANYDQYVILTILKFRNIARKNTTKILNHHVIFKIKFSCCKVDDFCTTVTKPDFGHYTLKRFHIKCVVYKCILIYIAYMTMEIRCCIIVCCAPN